MRRILFLLAFVLLITGVGISAYEIPETINIGLNSSGLLWEVALSADDGVYTASSFACPQEAEEESALYYVGHEPVIGVSSNATLLCNGQDTGETVVEFFSGSEFITCQNKTYRGSVKLMLRPQGILIVNCVGMDDYLYGVVGREMSESFPLEALKAQAVAARNYAIVKGDRHESEGFDLCNGVHCQAYGGQASEGEKVITAVNETSGKVLLYNGAVVECYYFSSDGGHTENSENVWYASLGYLKGKEDPYENRYEIPNYEWSVTFTAEQIKRALEQREIYIGEVVDVSVTEYTQNGYAKTLVIRGTQGTKEYYKDNIRASMPNSLRSNLFTLSKGDSEVHVNVLTASGTVKRIIGASTVLSANGQEQLGGGNSGAYTFSGTGYGHGVGMSQYGAKGMAEQGFTYIDILKFYYTDTEISG